MRRHLGQTRSTLDLPFQPMAGVGQGTALRWPPWLGPRGRPPDMPSHFSSETSETTPETSGLHTDFGGTLHGRKVHLCILGAHARCHPLVVRSWPPQAWKQAFLPPLTCTGTARGCPLELELAEMPALGHSWVRGAMAKSAASKSIPRPCFKQTLIPPRAWDLREPSANP